jgi:hypothetical protein
MLEKLVHQKDDWYYTFPEERIKAATQHRGRFFGKSS